MSFAKTRNASTDAAIAPGYREIRLQDYRCFASAELELGPEANFFVGENGAGKTSLLEALFLCGRGSSFRTSRLDTAVRHGCQQLIVFGRLESDGRTRRLGVTVGRESGLVMHLDGQVCSRQDLARENLSQILDPTSYSLIEGSPEDRRRFLDWTVFHVEPSFIGIWQRYRRALQQRNAALRTGALSVAWAWDDSIAELGASIDQLRSGTIAKVIPTVLSYAARLLPVEVEIRYLRGWPADLGLREVLERNRSRDAESGTTQSGPHRGDLQIYLDEHRARATASRGQEKLLAAAMTLGQLALVQEVTGYRGVLLIDELAADLDRGNVQRLEELIASTGCQTFATVLDPNLLSPSASARVFHVERGSCHALL